MMSCPTSKFVLPLHTWYMCRGTAITIDLLSSTHHRSAEHSAAKMWNARAVNKLSKWDKAAHLHIIT